LDRRGLVPVRAAFGRISSRDRLRPQPHGDGCLRREQGRRLYDRQARATRNTPSSIFFDWITGGLNSQIEHHMFPTMARRNLPKMRALTKAAVLECDTPMRN